MAKEVLPPLLHGGRDGKQFSNISRGSKQLWTKRLAKVSDGMAPLGQYSPHFDYRSISFNCKRQLKIRERKDRSGGQSLFQSVKSCLSGGVPLERFNRGGLYKRGGNGGITLNEPAVESGEAKLYIQRW